MKVVIATDGGLGPDPTVEVAKNLAGPDGDITVLTVVEVPRRLLSDLRQVYGERESRPIDTDAEYVRTPPSQPHVGASFPGEDAIIDRYLADQGAKLTGPLVQALQEHGIEATVAVEENESASGGILDYLTSSRADAVVMGARGRGLFEGMIGATSFKVSRQAPCAVVLVRDPADRQPASSR